MSHQLLEHIIYQPHHSLSEFVERCWMVRNHFAQHQEIIIVPDGRIDLMFTIAEDGSLESNMIGIENEPTQHTIVPGAIFMGVGLKLLAVEYCLKHSIAPILGKMTQLTSLNPSITKQDLYDFNRFCQKMSATLQSLITTGVDTRKQILFHTLYDTHGSLKIQEYAEISCWTSRQINRYFSEWFGLSLKEYCNILRFRASLHHIKEGKFFPEQNYSDQPHFIREVKRFTGVTPKELFKRQSDRFIQVSDGK